MIRRSLPTLAFALALANGVAAQSFDAAALPRRILFGAALQESGDSSGGPRGARVVATTPGAPAALAGVQARDVVVKLGGDTITSVAAMLADLRPMRANVPVPLTLWRSGQLHDTVFIPVERPREQAGDFTIEYTSVAASGGRHRVLITRPNDGARHPAVLMVGGIGCYSIDAPSGVFAYRDLAYHLTRRGYVTIRVEKLGMGDSEGPSCQTTDLDTEIDGYRQALHAARQSPWIDSSRIVLFGHSIGGIEAPVIAGESGGAPVRGVIVLSTAGISWYEYELANLRRQLVLADAPPEVVEQQMADKIGCMYRMLVKRESSVSIVASSPECAEHTSYPASDAYMQQVASRDPASNWRGVTAPVLLLHGATDFITAASEHAQLAAMLRAQHPGRAVTYEEVPELDHYLAREPSERASLTDPVSPLSRPYYGATLEPLIDRWLDGVMRTPS